MITKKNRMSYVFLLVLFTITSQFGYAKLVELEPEELSKHAAASGLSLVLNDFRIESDVDTFNGATFTTKLTLDVLTNDYAYSKVSGVNGSTTRPESITVSHLRLGKHNPANFGSTQQELQGVNLGTYEDPVTFNILPITNAYDLSGNTTNARTAMFLCFSGTDCDEDKNLSIVNDIAPKVINASPTTSEGMNLFAKVNFNSIDYTGKTGKTLYRRDPKVTTANASDYTFYETPHDLWLGVSNLKLGGSWASLWADQDKGVSFALRLKATADDIYLTPRQELNTTHGDFDGINDGGLRLSGVDLDLQLGRHFYQPVIISSNISFDRIDKKLVHGLALELKPITNDPKIYKTFYAATSPANVNDTTNVPNTIRINDVVLNGESLGGVLVEGIQIQYLKVSTRDVF